jgi:hypothetical protein
MCNSKSCVAWQVFDCLPWCSTTATANSGAGDFGRLVQQLCHMHKLAVTACFAALAHTESRYLGQRPLQFPAALLPLLPLG